MTTAIQCNRVTVHYSVFRCEASMCGLVLTVMQQFLDTWALIVNSLTFPTKLSGQLASILLHFYSASLMHIARLPEGHV